MAEHHDDNDQPNQDVQIMQKPLRLKKNIGLTTAVSYLAGGIIGVGIFVSPQTVLVNTGQSVGVALCVWVFCAFIAFCGALCYAELGTRIHKSGGAYTYIKSGLGDGAAFVFLWSQLVLLRPLSAGLGTLIATDYLLRPVFLQCPDLVPRSAKVLLALCLLGFLMFTNSYNTSWSGAVQVTSTVCKVSALLVIIIMGVVVLSRDGTANLQDMFKPENLTMGDLVFAVYSCYYAYVGWDSLNVAVEEVKNPRRNVPLAILMVMGLTTAVYLLAILSYHIVLTTPQIISGVAVAAVFMEVTVPPLIWAIVLCIAISAIGSLNTTIFVCSRFSFIGGRDKLFPEVLSMVSVSRKTPVVSCLLLGVVAATVILMGDVSTLLGAYSLLRSSGETLAILAMFRLRRKFTASKDTYVVPTAVPVFYLLVHISLAIMAITRDTSRFIIPLLLLLCGIPVYCLSTTRLFTQGPMKKLNDFLVDLSQKLLLCDYASKHF